MLVLVADGARMLLLRNEGSPANPDLRMVEHHEHRAPAAHDMVTGPRPSTSSPLRRGRDTVVGTDPHRQAEDRFLFSVADRLETWAPHAKALVVAAPPHALGTLRRRYSAAVRARLVAEIDKDFTGHTIGDIQRLVESWEPDRVGTSP